MAVPIPGTIPRVLDSGRTGAQTAAGFTRIRLTGQRELVQALLRAATRTGVDAQKPLNEACLKAIKPVMDFYRNSIDDVTGNLRRSVGARKIKNQRVAGVGVAVGGPRHVKGGKEWDVEKKGAGNHAWLVEFGTGRRRPSTQGRRTYLNVHQKVNGRFTPLKSNKYAGRFDNEDFEKMGDNRYFIMGSKNTPGRQHGSGYPHDFIMAIKPGQTYGEMTAQNLMSQAIRRAGPQALNTLLAALRTQIESLQRAA